jgi:hypothetical protein
MIKRLGKHRGQAMIMWQIKLVAFFVFFAMIIFWKLQMASRKAFYWGPFARSRGMNSLQDRVINYYDDPRGYWNIMLPELGILMALAWYIFFD